MIKYFLIGMLAAPMYIIGLAYIAHITDEVVFPLGIIALTGRALGVFAWALTRLFRDD